MGKEKADLLEGIKDLQNEYALRENQFRTQIAELEASNSQLKHSQDSTTLELRSNLMQTEKVRESLEVSLHHCE